MFDNLTPCYRMRQRASREEFERFARRRMETIYLESSREENEADLSDRFWATVREESYAQIVETENGYKYANVALVDDDKEARKIVGRLAAGVEKTYREAF